MSAVLRREIKNYLKRPLFWIGVLIVILGVFRNLEPYLDVGYVTEGEEPVNDYPDAFRDGDVYEGYVPSTEEERRQLWEEMIRKSLTDDFKMNQAEAASVISEMKGMDIREACAYLEKYGYYGAYMLYEDTEYHKGTGAEINSYIREKVEAHPFSYYFSRKFADFAGLYMGFFAALMLSVLYLRDTRKSTYELLHTKPIRAWQYVAGKAGGGFAVCLIVLGILALLFYILCRVYTADDGFAVRLSDFIIMTARYILPNMLMIVSIYGLIALVFKNPLPAVPLLILYLIYSNMGSRNADGVFGYYGRPLAVMVRFTGPLFETAPPPNAGMNQIFLLAASAVLLFLSAVLWKRRRM